MLRRKRIHGYFFMDNLIAMNKAGRLSQGHTCFHIFVIYKGFVYVLPMKYKTKVFKAVKESVKDIGDPDTIICDATSDQRSKSL